MRTVYVMGVPLRVASEDIAEALEELDAMLAEGSPLGTDLKLVLRALNYLKTYRLSTPGVARIVHTAEKILVKSFQAGEVDPWEILEEE